MSARFWIYWNDDFVKITVKEGKATHAYRYARDDEGWSSHHEVYRLQDGVVYNENYSDGRDCDGRFATSSYWCCPVADLKAYHEAYPDTPRPLWQKISDEQRDYSAEAMNY